MDQLHKLAWGLALGLAIGAFWAAPSFAADMEGNLYDQGPSQATEDANNDNADEDVNIPDEFGYVGDDTDTTVPDVTAPDVEEDDQPSADMDDEPPLDGQDVPADNSME